MLCGLGANGSILFKLALPSRGHAAAAHPTATEAVAFARRPGTYAIVLDCRSGRTIARLNAPAGRHFYGHGTFSADGDVLFTTENDFEAAKGMVGIWDVRNGYRRLGEFPSGGIGPHDIKLMTDRATLVVANGGIETHPDTGRTKLNLHSMRSTLNYLSLEGALKDQLALVPEHQRSSIRHLALAQNGAVAFAMQWQGDLGADLPLLGVHRIGATGPKLYPKASVRVLQGYLGSVAFNPRTFEIAATSPREGVLLVFGTGPNAQTLTMRDVCGVAADRNGFLATAGTGAVWSALAGETRHALHWDNHLIAVR